jgi:hypothetical protein
MAAVGPRRRDHTSECVINTEHRHLAAKCTPGRLWLSGRLVHDEWEDEVRWRAALQRKQGILSPSPQSERHPVIRRRALVVCPRRCPDVELPEELERDLGNTEAANVVPREEGIENLLCDVQNRKVLHLEPKSSSMTRELVFGAYLASVQLVFQEEAIVWRLVGRQFLIDRKQFLESVTDDLET